MGLEQFLNYKAQFFQFIFAVFVVLELQHLKGIKNFIRINKSFMQNLIFGVVNVILLQYLLSNTLERQILSSYSPDYFLSFFLEIICVVLFLDLFTYFWHRLNHRIEFLWRFHQIHHLDENLNSSSAVRFHCIEILFSYGLRYLLFLVLPIHLESYLAFELLYSFQNIFAHSSIQLNYRVEAIINRVFVTPRFHRIHHDPHRAIHDSNYSTIFSFWDRLFKSHNNIKPEDTVIFGLESLSENRLLSLMLLPFRDSKPPKVP